LAKATAAGLDANLISMGEQIVTISVLSIVIFAPLGAIAIMNLGPVLLSKEPLIEEDDLDEMKQKSGHVVEMTEPQKH
jgi:hypothetical protein